MDTIDYPTEDLHFVQKILPARTFDELPHEVLDCLEEMALDLAQDDRRIAVKALLEDLRKFHHVSINNNLCAPIADYLIEQHPFLEDHIHRRARIARGQHTRKQGTPPPEALANVPITALLDAIQRRLTDRGYPVHSISLTHEGTLLEYVLPSKT